MKTTVTTTNPTEAKRLVKANDMADFIWELKHTGWLEFKNPDYDHEPAWEKINDLLDYYGINVDDLF